MMSLEKVTPCKYGHFSLVSKLDFLGEHSLLYICRKQIKSTIDNQHTQRCLLKNSFKQQCWDILQSYSLPCIRQHDMYNSCEQKNIDTLEQKCF